MLLTLLGAALAAEPWLVDAREGRAFVPASLLSARPTLRVQVNGLDAAQLEIRHGDGPPCQVQGATVDLAVVCQKLFSAPVEEGGWTLRVGAGAPVALRIDDTYQGYQVQGEGLIFPYNPGYTLALFVDESRRYWVSDPGPQPAAGGFAVQRLDDSLTLPGLTLVGVWSFNGTQALSWEAAAPVAEPPATPKAPAPECPEARGEAVVVCYWVGASDPLWMSVSSGMIRPNTPIEVRVFGAPAGADVRASGSAAGLYSGRVDTAESVGGTQSGNKSIEEDGPTPGIVRHFSPRLPGAVTLELVISDKKTPIAELFVVDPVIGAVRLGVGVSNVTDAHYAAITAPGSHTPEIALSSSDHFAPELVVGFAPYVFDREGRVYAPGYGRHRIAPYVGLGLVSVSGDGSPALTPLKSVYLGGEVELVRSSSVALAFVLRRVSRLPEPYTIGSPFVGAAVPSVSTIQPGLALVINVSPDLFQVSQNPFNILGNL